MLYQAYPHAIRILNECHFPYRGGYCRSLSLISALTLSLNGLVQIIYISAH